MDAYRRYCWTVTSLDDMKLAPFHLLASEGRVHSETDHVWHMETIGKICGAARAGAPAPHNSLLLQTPFLRRNLLRGSYLAVQICVT